MPVYEYHPRELAQVSVLRKAVGLNLNQVKENLQAALKSQELALAAPQEVGRLTALDIASWQYIEWARIASAMTKQQIAVYSSDDDPRVARREEQRAQRIATEAAQDEEKGTILPIEVRRHRIYRITARPAAEKPPVIRHFFAGSAGAAIEHAEAMFRRPGSMYQSDEYRVTSIDQILPESGDFF
ncbi:hypothetical protein EF910_17900 [Streptomyces sp. WAC07149]|uniref:hypothetical protein n=1 Tax=Streptomyces sp. WAC07149 TaxID=2487425 RepID=UPI000F780950|nr:hypothetical protein [Streptomyces sp. WAC07149]RST04399.1 hypothetical protein EF910_17900 [Streptomyces sp. WAC07149]